MNSTTTTNLPAVCAKLLSNFVLALALVFLLGAQPAKAAVYYWDTTTTSTWSTGTNWSTSATGTPAGTTVPASTDTATFNGTSFYGATTVNLGGTISVGSIVFTNTGTTLLEGGGTNQILQLYNANALTENAGAGAVTIGSATSGQQVAVLLENGTSANQTFTNSGSTLMTLDNGISLATAATGTLTTAGTGSITLAGALSNGVSGATLNLIVSNGVTTLSGANAYSGSVAVTGGILNLTSAGALGTASGQASSVSVSSGAALDISATPTEAVGLTINGAGLTATPHGALDVTANNVAYAGTVTLGSASAIGVETTSTLTLSGSTAVALAGNALTLSGPGTGFISGNITGAGTGSALSTVDRAGGVVSGLWTLSGTNTYAGPTTVGGGTSLEFTKEVSLYDNQLSPLTGYWTASNIIVQGGGTLTFEVGNTGGFTAADIGTLSALGTSSGGFENGSFLGIDTTGASLTYSAVIANTNGGSNVLGLTKLGTNSLILNKAETYTGATTVTGGTLQIGDGTTNGSLASSSIYNTATLLFDPAAGTNETYSGHIGGSGAVTINGSTTGTVTLSGANISTGATTVSAGALDLKNSLALQNASLQASAGSLIFDSSVASDAFTIGAFGVNANPTLSLQNNAATPVGITLTLGGIGQATISSSDANALGGAGALTLFGFNNTFTSTAANTYAGPTTITGSTFNLGNATATGSIASTSALVLGGTGYGGTFSYTRTGTNAQTFAGTTINSGSNFIKGSLATQTINLGAITANTGGTVDFNSPGAINTTTTANTNGILGGYATFGGQSTWAVAPSVSGGAITGLANGSYTETSAAGTTPANYLNQNIDVNGNATLTSAITPNSLRFSSTTATDTLTLAGVNIIASGGILDSSSTQNATVTGGYLTSGSGQLDVITAGKTVTLGSTIIDNGTTSTSLVLSGTINGQEFTGLNANNSFSGGTYLNGGGIAALPSTGGTYFGTGTLTLGNAVFTGSGGGAIVFGGNATTNVVASGLIQSDYGANTSNGDLSGNQGGFWNLIGTGTATFNGIIGNYSAGRVINLALDSGTEIIGNTQIGSSQVIANGGTFQVGTGYWGTFSNVDNNVALVVGGGTYLEYGNLAGTTSQTFNSGLTINAGASTVSVTNNGSTGTVVNLNAVGTRNVGGTVNFVLPTGAQDAINGITTYQTNTNGILGGYATVGGTDWAANATNIAGGNIVGLSSITGGYTPFTSGTFAPGSTANVDVQGSATGITSQTVNSLRFNTSGANSLAIAASNTLTVASGGILNTTNVGGNQTTISGGTLVGASGKDLVIIQTNTTTSLTASGLNISSNIANNTSATALTVSGPGLVTLSGTNTYTGGLFLTGGVTLNTTSAGINAGTNTGGITFNGGTLQAANTITTLSGNAITVGVNGGTVDLNGNNVTLAGNISGVAGEGEGAGLYGGFNSTGVGLLSVVNSVSGTPSILALGGTTSAYYGGISINGNSTVQDTAASGTVALGTGYITFLGSGTPTLDVNGRNATVAGLIGAGTNGVVTNSTGTTGILTFDGVATQTFGGVIKNAVGITLNLNNPTESLILTNTNPYTGATTLTSGTLQIGNGTTAGSVSASSIADNTALIFDNPVGGNVTEAGTLSGTGTVTQEGAGVITLGNSAGGGLGSGFTGSVADYTDLNIGSNAAASTATITLNGTLNGTNYNNAILGYTGTGGTVASNVTVTTGTTGYINNIGNGTSAGTLTLSGNLSKNGATLDLESLTGGAFNVTGHITGSLANSDLNIIGTAVTLSNTDSYNGNTSVYGNPLGMSLYDVLATGIAGALPSNTIVTLGNSTAENAGPGGSFYNYLDLDGTSQTIAGLQSQNDLSTGGNDYANAVVNSNGSAPYTTGNGTAGSLTVDPASGQTYTFNGSLGVTGSSNNFSLTVGSATSATAQGTQVLTGNSTYTGTTTVNGGVAAGDGATLYANNAGGATITPNTATTQTITAVNSGSATGSGAVTVQANGTLAGSGTINGPVTVNGTLSSGAVQSSASSLVVNPNVGYNNAGLTLTSNLTVNTGSTLAFALGSGASSGSGYETFSNPNMNSTYLSMANNAAVSFATASTATMTIDLVDLTNGVSPTATLELRNQNPVLLIASDSNSDYNLWTNNGYDVNGYVTGTGTSGGQTDGSAFNIEVTTLNGTNITTNYQGLQLYLYNGDLEVIPEPGTWALMLGGLGVLVFWQRRRQSSKL